MDTKVNYVVVGIFVVFLTLAIAVATIWISGGQHTKKYNTYLTFVSEPVDGVTLKSPVKFNGVDVGYVDDISLNPKNPQEVRIEMKLIEGTPVNQSTVATIRSQGVTGFTYIGLHAMKKTAPPLTKPDEESYPVIPYSTSLFKQLDTVAQDVSKNITNMTSAMTEMLGEENQKFVRNILQNIESLTATLERNAETIESTLKSSDRFMKNTAEMSDDFEQMLKELDDLLTESQKTANEATRFLKTGRRTLKSGDRAIKDFTDQTLPNAYATLSKLKRVMTNVERLSHELNRNPSMLVRGKHPNPAGPGE